ncbi:MAG: 7-cyano-7-deazaguanine synthase QueC [Planctomycetota bacterium]
MPTGAKAAVVLLSGGIDSAAACAVAGAEGFSVRALTVSYGQRHACELRAARAVAASLGVAEHKILALDLASFGGSSLTGSGPVPKDRDEAARASGIPSTYVPGRNTVFLSLALAWAEAIQAHDIFLGVHALDASGYPDCRPEYVRAFERLANLATREGVEGRPFRIRAPFASWNKAAIIRRGAELGLDFSLTHSCYDPAEDGLACGRCDACRIRRRAFAEAGLEDPVPYPKGT